MDVLLNGLSIIGFLTLAGMDPVVEGNHGENSDRRVARILCLLQYGEIWLQFTFFIFMSVNKTNACMCYIATKSSPKEDCSRLIFLKTKYSV